MKLLLIVLLLCLLLPPLRVRQTTPQNKSVRHVVPTFLGQVRSIRVETARLSKASGEWAEQNRVLSSITFFDPDGNAIECDQYRPDESLGGQTTFNHDSNGNLSEVLVYRIYDGESHLRDRWRFIYDSRGNLVETDSYYPNGYLSAKWFYIYDAEGRAIERHFCNPDGSLISKDLLKYDESGRLIEEAKYKADSTFEHRWENTYDEKGNFIKRDFYGHEGTLFGRDINRYEFDITGNWIKQTGSGWMWYYNSIEAQPSHITYRIIEYY